MIIILHEVICFYMGSGSSFTNHPLCFIDQAQGQDGWILASSRSIKTQEKRTWPISTHLDQTSLYGIKNPEKMILVLACFRAL